MTLSGWSVSRARAIAASAPLLGGARLAAPPQCPRAGGQPGGARVLPEAEPQRPVEPGVVQARDAVQVLARLLEAAHAQERPPHGALGHAERTGVAALGDPAHLAADGQHPLEVRAPNPLTHCP